MTVTELLAECHVRGIILAPNGGQLGIDAPAGALTDDVLDRLKAHKTDLLTILSDGDAYEREERAAIVWCETAAAAEVDAALRAAIDDFQALCAEGAAPTEWPAPAADFVLLLAPDDLPPVPFKLNGWTTITDTAKFLRSLRADILRGPSGPRAFYGALQTDLLELQRLALAAAETGLQDAPESTWRGKHDQSIEGRPDALGERTGDALARGRTRREMADRAAPY